jgi:hypothetical protein
MRTIQRPSKIKSEVPDPMMATAGLEADKLAVEERKVIETYASTPPIL